MLGRFRWIIAALLALSISAMFYRSVIQEDFVMTGAWVEFYSADDSYLWFMYEGEEYELEITSTELQDMEQSIAEELGISTVSLDASFREKLVTAFEEATGAYIELTSEETSYVWISLEHEQYEFEFTTTDLEQIEESVAHALNMSLNEFQNQYLSEQLAAAYEYSMEENEESETGLFEADTPEPDSEPLEEGNGATIATSSEPNMTNNELDGQNEVINETVDIDPVDL